MEPDEREPFERLLAELFGAIDKPLTEAKAAGFWKGLARMEMVEFVRTQELLLADLQEGAPPKNFTVHDIWEARKRLRAIAQRNVVAPAPPKFTGDSWVVAGNRHLLAAVLRAALPVASGPRRVAISGYQPAEMTVLLHARDEWCRVMREEAQQTDGSVDVETQQGMWNSFMAQAHHKIGRPYIPRELKSDGIDRRQVEPT